MIERIHPNNAESKDFDRDWSRVLGEDGCQDECGCRFKSVTDTAVGDRHRLAILFPVFSQ